MILGSRPFAPHSTTCVLVIGLTLVIFSFSVRQAYVLTTAGCQPLSSCHPLPGVWHVGEGVDILDWQVKPSPFELSYSSGAVTPDRAFLVPDGSFFLDVNECAFSMHTAFSSTYHDFQQTTSRSVKVDVAYKEVSGSYTADSSSAREHIYKYQQTVSSTFVNCIQYDVLLVARSQKLHPYFNASVLALPRSYNQKAYFDFLQTWGTHYRQRVRLGGLMLQYSFTSSSYVKQHTINEVKRQARAKFYQSLSGGSSRTTDVTDEYQQNTETNSIHAIGGLPWQAGDDKWTQWASSVPSRPEVIYEELSPITDILAMRNFPSNIQQNLLKALEEYAFRRGCTHPGTPTYDPEATLDDGSCNDIPEQLRCTGTGHIHTVPDGCMDDGGVHANGDSLQIYCCDGMMRFCLSGEGCPWRSGCLASHADKTCSRSGLSGSYMASLHCDNVHNIVRVDCDNEENVLLQ